MNAPQLVVALQTDDKNGRVRHIAHQIAEFRHAQLHVIQLIQTGTDSKAGACATALPAKPHANEASWSNVRPNDEQTEAIPANAALETIVKTANSINAELVIVRADRRRGLRRLLPSATHRLSHAIDCSVLTIRSNGSTGGYRRISIAIDPSRSPTKVTQTALHFSRLAIRVNVVTVIPLPLRTVPNLENLSGLHWSSMEDTVRFKRQVRSEAADALRGAGLHPKIMDVRTGDTFYELMASAKKMRTDLMIICLDKRQPRNRWLSRSTLRRLLDQMPCDVLVCRD